MTVIVDEFWRMPELSAADRQPRSPDRGGGGQRCGQRPRILAGSSGLWSAIRWLWSRAPARAV